MFQWQKINEITLLTVTAFSDTGLVSHGFTSRTGGVSPVPYQSLNMGFTVNDEHDNVIRNRQRVADGLGFPLEDLVAAKQVHGDRVAVITGEQLGKGALTYDTALKDTDALITDQPGIPISTYHADCIPVLLLDPVTPAIGLAHAGWKGTALQIGAKTLAKMTACYGTNPQDCLAAIGPGIGPCCYEVDDKVKDVFARQFAGSEDFFKPVGTGHWHLDLWLANAAALQQAGVPQQNIFVSGLCTSCNHELFFSHRRDKGQTGRMASLMMLKW